MAGFNNEVYRLSFVVVAGDDRVVVSGRHRGGRVVSGLRASGGGWIASIWSAC